MIEIDGVVAGTFSECSSLSTDIDFSDYSLGSEENTARKQPGLKKFSNITLKRGMTENMILWNWHKAVTDGCIVAKEGVVTLLDEAREPALKWRFKNGWPSKWVGPSLNPTGNEMAVEILEITHEGLERIE